ncbi:MAG TPA: Npt1/Npt2 family nucleotide transporter [Burkholderiales bacterium]|nr:Npt1/Npt2 family nucleotide transporter [Burkholderiales bacterium]
MSVAVLHRWLARLVAVRPGEVRALCWSFAYFFCLLAGYYVLRPLRDEMGIAGGVRNLPWLFTATFVVMLAVVPVFGAVVARLPRQRFIPLVYHFFVANIAIFWLLLTFDIATVQTARVFFVWISVFNLFAVSVFWSFMADLYASGQGKRLYGFIAAGGSAGALLGPALTVGLAGPLGPVNLLILAALLLEAAVLCAWKLEKAAPQLASEAAGPAAAAQAARADTGGLGGGWLAGIGMLLRSPYLAGIASWVALLSLAGTFLYFQQANIVASASDDPAVRTRIFATIDLAIGILTLLVQFLVTGRVIQRFGAGPAAAFLPFVFALGFVALWLTPALWVVIAFQAVQRAANFAISNPAREVLFTVLDREEKYKAKNVIDIVVFRGGDAASGWLFAALRGAGLDLGAISLATVPVTVAWLALALALGRMHERRTRNAALSATVPPAKRSLT